MGCRNYSIGDLASNTSFLRFIRIGGDAGDGGLDPFRSLERGTGSVQVVSVCDAGF